MEYNHCVLFVILCIASAGLCVSRENGQERTNGTFIQQLAWRMSGDIGYVIEDVKVLIMMQEKQQDETQLMKEEMKKQHDEQRQLMKEEMKKQYDEQRQLMKEEMKKQRDEQRQLMKEEMKKHHDEQQLLLQQLDKDIFYGKDKMVILRRIDNKYNFDTHWANYKAGFGDRNGSFWLGLEEIHRLTSRWNYALRIDLTDWDDSTAWARYDQCYIAGEDEGYMLRVGIYSGTAGDSLAYHNGMLFSTRDMDNDKSSSLECAIEVGGGWWYNACSRSALTGPYRSEDQRYTWPGMWWRYWKGHYSYKRAEMTLVLR